MSDRPTPKRFVQVDGFAEGAPEVYLQITWSIRLGDYNCYVVTKVAGVKDYRVYEQDAFEASMASTRAMDWNGIVNEELTCAMQYLVDVAE